MELRERGRPIHSSSGSLVSVCSVRARTHSGLPLLIMILLFEIEVLLLALMRFRRSAARPKEQEQEKTSEELATTLRQSNCLKGADDIVRTFVFEKAFVEAGAQIP